MSAFGWLREHDDPTLLSLGCLCLGRGSRCCDDKGLDVVDILMTSLWKVLFDPFHLARNRLDRSLVIGIRPVLVFCQCHIRVEGPNNSQPLRIKREPRRRAGPRGVDVQNLISPLIPRFRLAEDRHSPQGTAVSSSVCTCRVLRSSSAPVEAGLREQGQHLPPRHPA